MQRIYLAAEEFRKLADQEKPTLASTIAKGMGG
jgi:hypothetical protein